MDRPRALFVRDPSIVELARLIEETMTGFSETVGRLGGLAPGGRRA
jgi:hypothetical protein